MLVINRLRTPQARRFQAASLEQSLKIMGGDDRVARSLAAYWRQARMCRPDDALLQFLGCAAESEQPVQQQQQQQSADDLARPCSDVFARAVPQLCETLRKHLDERFDALARRFEAQRGDNIVNLNVRAPKRPLQNGARQPPLSIAAVGGGQPLPVAKYLDEKQRLDPSFAQVRQTFKANFAHVAMALHKAKLADAGLRPQYVWQNQRRQIYYGEAHRPTLDEAWDLCGAHRHELMTTHSGGPQRPVSAGRSVVDLLRGWT